MPHSPMPLRNKAGDSPAKRATADLRSQLPIHRRGSGFAESGVPELAWLRGHHAGLFDAYKAIAKQFPEAANALNRKFAINSDGTLG
jgi:hypothetical protein